MHVQLALHCKSLRIHLAAIWPFCHLSFLISLLVVFTCKCLTLLMTFVFVQCVRMSIQTVVHVEAAVSREQDAGLCRKVAESTLVPPSTLQMADLILLVVASCRQRHGAGCQ